MVSRHSRHNYELRYWLAAGGIHPDRDVELIVVPPVHMVAQLEQDAIDGFCVGEPWNSIAVRDDIGRTLISSYEIWNNGPEKVLGYTALRRIIQCVASDLMALLEASQWLDDPANRDGPRGSWPRRPISAAGGIIALHWADNIASRPRAPARTPTSMSSIAMRPITLGARTPHGSSPRCCAGANWRSRSTSARHAAVYRTQPYREAAAMLGLPYPLIDYKVEGRHTRAWTLNAASQPIAMGTDCFLDGREFDADAIVDYLGGFALHGMKVSLAELGAQNA